jgi:phosphatidylglycerophosphatase A
VTRLAVFVATVAYCGYFPIAPGTVGSAAGLLFYLLVWWAQSPVFETGLVVVLFAAGVWAGTTAERYFGGIDPGPIVIDEVVGMLITLAFIPVGWSGALAGFVLFRIYDVLKPYPAGRFERLHGGLGVMADDAMAAVYANISLRIAMWLLPAWIVRARQRCWARRRSSPSGASSSARPVSIPTRSFLPIVFRRSASNCARRAWWATIAVALEISCAGRWAAPIW